MPLPIPALFRSKSAEERATREQLQNWRNECRSQMRSMTRDIRGIERQQRPVVKSIKAALKRADSSSARILAKELVHSRKAIARLTMVHAQMDTIRTQCQLMISQRKALGATEKSAEIMEAINQLVLVPEAMSAIQELQASMITAGILEEMAAEAVDHAMIETDDLDAEADEEVERVMLEIAVKTTAGMKSAPTWRTSGAAVAGASRSVGAAASDSQVEVSAGL